MDKKKKGTVIIVNIISIAVIASLGKFIPKKGSIGIGNNATNHSIPKNINLFHLILIITLVNNYSNLIF
jgi:hypothetical protein